MWMRASRSAPIRSSIQGSRSRAARRSGPGARSTAAPGSSIHGSATGDRKSTRLNSSHSQISYAVFCLQKKTELHAEVRDVLAFIAQPTEPQLAVTVAKRVHHQD